MNTETREKFTSAAVKVFELASVEETAFGCGNEIIILFERASM